VPGTRVHLASIPGARVLTGVAAVIRHPELVEGSPRTARGLPLVLTGDWTSALYPRPVGTVARRRTRPVGYLASPDPLLSNLQVLSLSKDERDDFACTQARTLGAPGELEFESGPRARSESAPGAQLEHSADLTPPNNVHHAQVWGGT
jgi:hypothetical protein